MQGYDSDGKMSISLRFESITKVYYAYDFIHVSFLLLFLFVHFTSL